MSWLTRLLLGRSEGPGRETRETQPFTDAIVNALVQQASTGAAASTTATAAVESAAGLLGRAFAGAKVSPDNEITRGLTPSVLNTIGRDMTRRGESLWVIGVSEGAVSLHPVGAWDVRGDPVGHGRGEAGWYYRLDLFGPSSNVTRYLPASSVLHFRHSIDVARPWQGLSPIAWAAVTAKLQAESERSLGDEMTTPVAQLIAVPHDGGDGEAGDELAMLKKDIGSARGRALLLETVAAGWADGASAAPNKDWVANRLGPSPPTAVNTARRESMAAILAALGTPPDLMDPDSSGTAQREAYRRWYASTAQPIARIVEHELTAKLETPVTLDLSSLYAHDLVGRAAAFQRLVAGGVSINEALTTSGLLAADAEGVAA